MFDQSATVDLLGYKPNIYSILIYSAVLIVSYLLCRRSFSRVQSVFLAVLTVLMLEIAWELPYNLIAIPSLNIPLTYSLLVLVRYAVSVPFAIYIWVYHSFKYGKPKLLILFTATILLDIILCAIPNIAYTLTHVAPWTVRVAWAIVTIVNVDSWNKTKVVL